MIPRDLRRFHDLVLAMHESQNLTELGRSIVTLLPPLIPGSFHSVDEVGLTRPFYALLGQSGELDKFPTWAPLVIPANPLIPLAAKNPGRCFILSKDVSASARRRSAFGELFRTLGLVDQLGVIVPFGNEGHGFSMAINRDARFRSSEAALIALLRQHLDLSIRRLSRSVVPLPEDFLRLRQLGLTARECQVLHWIAQGKRDREIGTILGVAHGTARKHTENVLAKLGVETRTAAAQVALDWLRRQAAR